jgi:hypothetical protein
MELIKLLKTKSLHLILLHFIVYPLLLGDYYFLHRCFNYYPLDLQEDQYYLDLHFLQNSSNKKLLFNKTKLQSKEVKAKYLSYCLIFSAYRVIRERHHDLISLCCL